MDMHARLTELASEAGGVLRYDHYIEAALYDSHCGYYRADRKRVGLSEKADFYTASSMGAIFRELVLAGVETLESGHDLSKMTFVEIGTEGEASFFEGMDTPFAATKSIRTGDVIDLSGELIVFSNELLDAQPFRRFVFKDGAWSELGVEVSEEGLKEVCLAALEDAIKEQLPDDVCEGYTIDLPTGAEDLMRTLVSQDWKGLLLFFDYGKTWDELIYACPGGTGRAYQNHRLSNDLLASPGEQDLTCHLCWDRLLTILQEGGFNDAKWASQESFFVHQSRVAIEAVAVEDAMSPRKRNLMQLLHPVHMGQKFQVLSAGRWRA